MSNFLKLHDVSKAVSVSIFRQRTTYLVDPLDQVILSHCAPHKQYTFYDAHLRTDLVQGSNGTMATVKLKINYKTTKQDHLTG